ncbi:hypothetical protein KAM341_42730 [Aeromonas caviae]|nr:hypothetical protein KAM341_42730 [Aeromonas caviae]
MPALGIVDCDVVFPLPRHIEGEIFDMLQQIAAAAYKAQFGTMGQEAINQLPHVVRGL